MQLIGLARLGRDAEARAVGDNTVANLSLAFDYYDPKAEKKRSTTWIDAALWGRQAEALEQYLLKGTQVCVTVDDVHIEEYEGKNGTGHKLVGRVSNIKLAGGRQEGAAPSSAPAPAPARRAPAPKPPTGFDDMGDDIPF